MKEMEDLKFPQDVRYTSEHEWARVEGDLMVVGISDYAQNQLGDIVFVELPEVGSTFEQGEEFGTVESVKAVSELFMPMAGEVMEINLVLEDEPELVNNAPYAGGWMLKIKAGDPDEFDQLMDKESYLASLKE